VAEATGLPGFHCNFVAAKTLRKTNAGSRRSFKDKATKLTTSSDNFKFSATTAEFGMLLRDSEFESQPSYENVLELSQECKRAGHGRIQNRVCEACQESFAACSKLINNISHLRIHHLNNDLDVIMSTRRTVFHFCNKSSCEESATPPDSSRQIRLAEGTHSVLRFQNNVLAK